MNNYETVIKASNQLSAQELINLLKVRTKVFVVEQNCPYQEVDDKDNDAVHVFFKKGNQILAYARIVPFDQTYMSVGRVLVVKEFRQHKLGRQIFATAINELTQRFPNKDIKIQAQSYLKNFYGSFGFKAVSDLYLEDGISHVDMVLQNQ